MTLDALLDPISRLVMTLDLADCAASEAALERAFPVAGPHVAQIEAAARAALADGTLCQRGEPGMKFSRFRKPEKDPAGCSIDAVYMEDRVGPGHTHTRGEVCLCFPDGADARFEGRSDRWMVLPPGSTHRPTVTNGSMLILYWWPEGAVAWE